MRNLTLPLPTNKLQLVAAGITSQTRAEWVDGKRTDNIQQRNGADLHFLEGVLAVFDGANLDVTISTTTPLPEGLPAGTMFRVEGEAELYVRGQAQAGFNGGAPRATLVGSLYCEKLTPVNLQQPAK